MRSPFPFAREFSGLSDPSLGPLLPFVVGITGGIGCGKSVAATVFARKKIAVIDADIIAHQLTAPNGDAILAIKAAFGDEMIAADGSLNRHAMREWVFQDASVKLRLEAILHPAIREEINRQISVHRRALGDVRAIPLQPQSPYILLVIPLLFESFSYRRMVTRTLVIDCPQLQQIERVIHRSANMGNLNGKDEISVDEARRIIASQIPRALRLQLADDVIFNNTSAAAFEVSVELLHERYLAHAAWAADNVQNALDL